MTTKVTLQLDQEYYVLISSYIIENDYVPIDGFRGSLIVEGNLFLAKLEEIYHSHDGFTYNWYPYYRQPYFYGQIIIDGNTLSWKIDFNHDSDYDDLHEQVTLTRQI